MSEPRATSNRAPSLLLVGLPADTRASVERSVSGDVQILGARDEEEARVLMEEREPSVVCLGAGVPGERARRFVEAARECRPEAATVFLVLAGGAELTRFQELIDRDALFYLSAEPVTDADLAAILRSALVRWWTDRRRSATRPGSATGERLPARRISRMQQALDAARRVAMQRELGEAGALVTDTIASLLDADRGYYLVYDPVEEVLRAGEPESLDERVESSAVGLVSFVVRTGRAVARERIDADPRYERDADDPEGSGAERFLAVPMPGVDGRVRGVLAAVRAPHRPEFSDEDREVLQMLADQVGPTFGQLVLQQSLDAEISERDLLGDDPLFRREAVEAHTEGLRDRGELLRLSPGWAAWTYRLILGVVAAALAFSMLGSLREYARGPAVVRMPGHREVTAVTSGTVTAVEVESGFEVDEGDVLLRLHGGPELAELRRLEREIEQQLIARLRDPADVASEQSLITLRAQWELAQARLEETVVRAPEDAVVGSVRVRRGQHVAPGQTLVSLSASESEPVVVALLPGQYLPQVEQGMSLRLELRGYPQSYQRLEVHRVSDGAVGPAEARRVVGEDVADALAVSGPVVLVEARLGSATFEIGGERFEYHDGMYAVAEVPVRSDRILLALFPKLRQWWEALGG